MFIDYVSLMLINMGAGLFILALYVLKGLDSKDQRMWIPGFAISGLIALINGFHMIWTWPLPGSYNMAYGEMSILLGFLFLGTAISLAMEWGLIILGVYAFFSGIAAVLIGIQIKNLGLTLNPKLTYIGFVLSGLGGIFSSLVVYLRRNNIIRSIGAIILLVTAVIWLYTGYMAYWAHMKSLSKWVPAIMASETDK